MLKKAQLPVAVVTAIYMTFFTFFYILRQNYEFLVHIVVLLLVATLILYTNKKVNYYPVWLLWGLSLWGLLHMSGGAFYFGETRLYEIMLIPLSQTLQIFRYDQAVHMFGFGVTTLVFHHILKRPKVGVAMGIVLVAAGTGAGAIYEIIEFLATLMVTEHGVGGYVNNSLDLISNFIGSVLAVILIKLRS
tara:strand:+ start:6171 stop:6740 length:570 start_codon:yes stop_codon:yes gene_type:complete